MELIYPRLASKYSAGKFTRTIGLSFPTSIFAYYILLAQAVIPIFESIRPLSSRVLSRVSRTDVELIPLRNLGTLQDWLGQVFFKERRSFILCPAPGNSKTPK